MSNGAIKDLGAIQDLNHAVEIADRVWWVGHYLENDPFQCHCYLIEQGDRSVLVDPGSKLTIEHTLKKIEQVIPFSSIKYFLCQHQDPDIAGAMPVIDKLVSRDDAVLVTHWRAQVLLKHYGLKMPFWLIDQNAWQLQLEDRTLKFVLTPYAHFPGAFVSFDERCRILFSSDLFGGFTEDFSLVAQDEGYFEAMRPFHEHYMPSKEVLGFAMSEIEPLPMQLIAPQHGSLIPQPLIQPMINKLMNLDCGLYLLSHGDTDIRKLSRLNQTLRDITHTMLLSREFREIADRLFAIMQRTLPVVELDFFALFNEQHHLYFSPETRYRGSEVRWEADQTDLLGKDLPAWEQWVDQHQGIRPTALDESRFCLLPGQDAEEDQLMIPLIQPDSGKIQAIALIKFYEPLALTGQLEHVINQMTMPLQVAIEREVIYRMLEHERLKLYDRSIHDPLTGLYSRIYMSDAVKRMCDLQDRSGSDPISAVLMDIDHFKQINDTFGHNQGDEVLRKVAQTVLEMTREGDIAIRLGGEEFILFGTSKSEIQVKAHAERIRQEVRLIPFELNDNSVQVTVSIGTAIRNPGEPLEDLIERADRALYQAKRSGRDKVVASIWKRIDV